MVTDCQVRLLMKQVNKGKKLSVAAAKAGMDEKTARKYRRLGCLPSEVAKAHTWRTREDPFSGIWDEVRGFLEINPGSRRLALDIETPVHTRASHGINVRVKTSSGPGTDVIILAVDEGILQITQFETPDPFEFFYRKTALTTKLFSIFDLVLPNVKALKLAVGGGEGEYDVSRRHLNPIEAKRVQSVALYSGVLKTDENGYVSHKFKVPKFNGKVRVMVLAAGGKPFSSC